MLPRRLMSLALALALAACASGPQQIKTAAVTIVSAPDLNGDQPLAVDLVYVTDADLLARLSTLPARDWFDKRRQFELDYPKGLTVKRWELAPGVKPVVETVPQGEPPVIGAFLFAAYRTAGDHRARVDVLERPQVRLGAQTLKIEEAEDKQ